MRCEKEEDVDSLRGFFGRTHGHIHDDRKPRVGKNKNPGPSAPIDRVQCLRIAGTPMLKIRTNEPGIDRALNVDVLKFAIRIRFKTCAAPSAETSNDVSHHEPLKQVLLSSESANNVQNGMEIANNDQQACLREGFEF